MFQKEQYKVTEVLGEDKQKMMNLNRIRKFDKVIIRNHTSGVDSMISSTSATDCLVVRDQKINNSNRLIFVCFFLFCSPLYTKIYVVHAGPDQGSLLWTQSGDK